MPLSLTPPANPALKKSRIWLIVGLFLLPFLGTGCGLKDDLILPDENGQQTSLKAPLKTTLVNTIEAVQ